jgi:hypothetical protein
MNVGRVSLRILPRQLYGGAAGQYGGELRRRSFQLLSVLDRRQSTVTLAAAADNCSCIHHDLRGPAGRIAGNPQQGVAQPVAPILPSVTVPGLDVAHAHARGFEDRHDGSVRNDQRLI